MWYQLKIEYCPSPSIEEVNELLENTGALSVMLTDKNDDPVLEPEPGATPLWPEVIIQALYPQATEAQRARALLQDSYPMVLCSMEILPDKDWERVWMDDFKPQRFGRNLWVCPTNSTPPEPLAVNLMLDPGLAFGTGSHGTTSLCLTWLDKTDLDKKSLIDYGCGSGILALAALKLGAQPVFAVDIDPQALQATQNNASTNNIPLNQLQIDSPEALKTPVDILIANILLGPLVSLKARFKALLHSGGVLVVSGILESQAAELIESYQPDFKLITQERREGWSLLEFQKVS